MAFFKYIEIVVENGVFASHEQVLYFLQFLKSWTVTEGLKCTSVEEKLY